MRNYKFRLCRDPWSIGNFVYAKRINNFDANTIRLNRNRFKAEIYFVRLKSNTYFGGEEVCCEVATLSYNIDHPRGR